MRTNATVKLFRDGDPSGLGSDFTAELVESRIPAWLRFNRSIVITAEGMEAVSDGSARFEKNWKIKEGDVIELQSNKMKRYRIEAVGEIYSSAGSLVGYDCTLVRDSSIE